MPSRIRVTTGLVGTLAALIVLALIGAYIFTGVTTGDLYNRVAAVAPQILTTSGPQGPAATIAVGTTTTGAAASVTNVGTSGAAILDFVFPEAGTTLTYASNVTTSGTSNNATYVTLNSLTLTSNQTFLLQWDGVFTNIVGGAPVRWRIASPPGTIIGQSNRQMTQVGGENGLTSAIYSVTSAPQTFVLEWSTGASGTTYTVAVNHFYAIAIGSGAVTAP